MKSLFVLLLLASPAFSQEPSPSPSPAPVDLSDIERALSADQSTQSKAHGKTPSLQSPSSAPGTRPVQPSEMAAGYAPQATPGTQGPSSGWASVGRFFQSLNPDMSVILDMAGGYYSDAANAHLNGDDPAHTGFNIEELELAFQAVVDPYLRADVFLTIPNLGGLEVEEAFITTTHLPGNFQLKAGIFRAGFGRQNTQHLHIQDFTRRPAMNAIFLGTDGLHSPGLEVNWLVPGIPFYLLVGASAFSVDPADPDQPLQTFGGGARYDFTYVGYAKMFFPLTPSTSLYAGLSFASGNTSQRQTLPGAQPCQNMSMLVAGTTLTACDNYSDFLYGADLYLKWKPVNVAQTWASLAWQTEFYLRQIPVLHVNGGDHPQLEGALYSQVVAQLARRWFLGLRGELDGLPTGAFVQREYAGALSLTWQLSEFARLRAYGEVRFPDKTPTNGAAFLQAEVAIGAHGAHPF